jgi:hypothetical protein
MDNEVNNEHTENQLEKQKDRLWLKPWQFKPGQSGNPKGRPVGTKSLKQRARDYLLSLNDEEAMEFLKGMDKKDIWEMAEGKAKQDVDVKAEMTSKIIKLDE